MDYGKTAYLKILNLEKELSLKTNNENNSNNYFEINKPNINESISHKYPLTITFPEFKTKTDKTISFQIKTSIFCNIECSVEFILKINKCIIYQEDKFLKQGENDVIILKTYNPLSDGISNVELTINYLSQESNATILNLTSIISGIKSNISYYDVEMKALQLNNDNVLISFVDNNKLYYLKTPLIEQSLTFNDFKYLLPAKNHCFCFNTNNDNEHYLENSLLFRIDTDGDLYVSNIFKEANETFIDNEVSVVFASTLPSVSDSQIILTYIKNGSCYYRTIRDDIISTAKELPLPTGEYTDIVCTTSKDCERIYIIASHQNGSNYMLHSLTEVATGKITEFLSAKCDLSVCDYIDISSISKLTENLKLKISPLLESILYYNETIERLSKEHIVLACEIITETYEITPPITYGVKLDKSILTGTKWATYTDDAVGLSGAYMDFTNDIFVDNGWTNRFPFNKIKPCILKDGKVLGYVNPNDYDYYEDGTPTNINVYGFGYLMVEFPKVYYKISRDDNYITIQISNTKQEGFVCNAHTYKGTELDKLYISVYQHGRDTYDEDLFRMRSGSYINTKQLYSYETHYDILKKHQGERFEFMPYNVVIMLQCMYAIMFCNTNCQLSLGYGYPNERKTFSVGQQDQKGMYYGKKSQGYGTKLFGLENLYAAKNTLVTGFYIDSNKRPRFIDVKDKNSSYHPNDISSYITNDKDFYTGFTSYRIATDINEDANNVGFFAKKITSTNTNGFCDGGNFITASSSCLVWGTPSTYLVNGIYSISPHQANKKAVSHIARLVYYPE